MADGMRLPEQHILTTWITDKEGTSCLQLIGFGSQGERLALTFVLGSQVMLLTSFCAHSSSSEPRKWNSWLLEATLCNHDKLD